MNEDINNQEKEDLSIESEFDDVFKSTQRFVFCLVGTPSAGKSSIESLYLSQKLENDEVGRINLGKNIIVTTGNDMKEKVQKFLQHVPQEETASNTNVYSENEEISQILNAISDSQIRMQKDYEEIQSTSSNIDRMLESIQG